MRRDILLPTLAAIGGAVGFALRRWQLTAGYDPDTQLFVHNHPAKAALILLILGLLVSFAVLIRGAKGPSDFLSAFHCPYTGYMTGMATAGLLLLGAAGLGLINGMQQLALWRSDPESQMLTYPLAILFSAVLCIPAGPSALLLGQAAYRGEVAENRSLLAVFLPIAALSWLFTFHLGHGTDPILMGYGFSLAAITLLMLAQYELAAFFHGRPHPRRYLFFALSGGMLGLLSLADPTTPFFVVLTISFTLSSLVGAWAVLRNTFGPPWPKHLLSQRMSRWGQDEDNSPE
ncbi:MAG: hypothetical protein ACOX7N_03220 [Lawsonibacter sp.]